MNRKILGVLAIVAVIMTASACSKDNITNSPSSNDSNYEQSGNKGKRENPYGVGDTVKLFGIRTFYNQEPIGESDFDLEFTVDEAFTISDGKAIMSNNGFTYYGEIPAAKVTFKFEGDYSGEFTWSDIINVAIVNEKMQSVSFLGMLDLDSLEDIYSGFTGYEYSYYVGTEYDSDTNEGVESRYLSLEYNDANNNSNTIYFDLTVDKSKNNSESADSSSVGQSGNEDYDAAVAAEEKGYLKVAENLYKAAGDFRDAPQKYEELKEVLSQYNGTYYGDSIQFDKVKVYLYILDGEVRTQFEGMEVTPSGYELYNYGKKADGTVFPAFSDKITDQFKFNIRSEYGDGYTLDFDFDGSGDYLVAATKDSSWYTWNGFYKKISDDVDASLFE